MSTANNPEIGLIVNQQKSILNCIAEKRYEDALQETYCLINLMREGHRDKDLLEKIKVEYNRINKMQPSKVKGYLEAKRFEIMDWVGEANNTLYVHEYLVDSGYSFHDPSGGRTSE